MSNSLTWSSESLEKVRERQLAGGAVASALAWSGGELAKPPRHRDLGGARRRASAPRLAEPRRSTDSKRVLQGCKLACNLLSVV